MREETTPDAYERLFREAGPMLWRTLYGFTGGRSEIAEEAMAEAFARAMEQGSRVRDPLAYIYRTAFRCATSELKRERRTAPELDRPKVAPASDLEDLMRALRQLSPNQRAAVLLRFEADLPTEEVAHRMGISAATVRVHIHRGRKRLRELLSDEEDPS